MKKEAFKGWLEWKDRKEGKERKEGTISSVLSRAGKVEAAYEDLDDLWDQNGLQLVLRELEYSKGDQQQGRPNPSKVQIKGNPYDGLQSHKSAVKHYADFRKAEEPEEPMPDANREPPCQLRG